jgi:hypothetical protein
MAYQFVVSLQIQPEFRRYIGRFDVGLNVSAYENPNEPDSISHLILWELDELINRQKSGWERTQEEKITREKFLAKLDEQVIKVVERLKREQNENQEKMIKQTVRYKKGAVLTKSDVHVLSKEYSPKLCHIPKSNRTAYASPLLRDVLAVKSSKKKG